MPKSLLPVAGKPILAHILDSTAKLAPEETIIVTGFLGEMVKEYVSEHYDLKARFVQQDNLLGLGYAVNLALQGTDDDSILVLLGDTIVETDMEAFVSKDKYVLGLMPVDNPQRFGIADLSDGYVTKLEEKPDNPNSNMAVIGLYYFDDSSILRKHLETVIGDNRKTKGEFQLTDALQGMVEDGVKFAAHPVEGWYDCGKRETLIETNRHLLEKSATECIIKGSVVIQPSYIAPSAIVESSIIGPHVSISDRAVVKSSIIKNSIIGLEAEVRNALLMDSLIGHNAVVFGDFRSLNVGNSSEIGYF
jgi:glucose-1-phosphate thymidylyltransferase